MAKQAAQRARSGVWPLIAPALCRLPSRHLAAAPGRGVWLGAPLRALALAAFGCSTAVQAQPPLPASAGTPPLLRSAAAPSPALAPSGSLPASAGPPERGPALQPDAAPSRELVLDRRRRRLVLLEQGRELLRFPVAVGRPGWETPVGQFRVIELVANPVWEHPATGSKIGPGPSNPLGSRWIGFHRDCRGRSGFNGSEQLVVRGCVSAGFHGTPNRSSVGQAVSHGCVRLYDEHVRQLFELVQVGTPVTVLP